MKSHRKTHLSSKEQKLSLLLRASSVSRQKGSKYREDVVDKEEDGEEEKTEDSSAANEEAAEELAEKLWG